MPSRRELLGSLASGTLAGMAGCLGITESPFSPGTAEDTDWPMPRYGPRNTAYARDAAGPRTDVSERWTATPGVTARPPVVADGRVFASASGGLVALDGASGEAQWRFAPSDRPWPSAPVVHDGVVYVMMRDDDTLYAVDAVTGEERWARGDVGSIYSSPHLVAGELVDEALVLVGGNDGVVHALDSDGVEQWQVDTFGGVRSMAYDGRGLFIGTTSGEVYAYYPGDTDDQPNEFWRQKVDGPVESILPTSNGIVVGATGTGLTTLDADRAGAVAWQSPGEYAGSPPVHAGTWVYSTGWESLSSLRVYDENLHWRVDGDFDNTGPVGAGDTLYVPGTRAVHAYALSGGVGGRTLMFDAKRWTHDVDVDPIRGLAVADGALFVAGESREGGPSLVCLEPA